jgi:hypothetical protein
VSLAAGLLAVCGLAVGAVAAPRAGEAQKLSDVSVEEVDGATVVSLYGLADAEWEANSEADGKAVRIRLSGVKPEFMPGNLVVNDTRVATVAFNE